MFKKLAHAYKKRGDAQTDPSIGALDHFHALCNYMLSFYFADKSNSDVPSKQSIAAWKSLFPFAEVLLRKLQERKLDVLWGLCTRLLALIRFAVHGIMVDATIPLVKKKEGIPAEMVESLVLEHAKAKRLLKDSEQHASFASWARLFPGSFKRTVLGGDFLAGVVLGGEAGVSVGPGYPLSPLSELNLAALAVKCILAEWVSSMGVDYAPITSTDDFM
ncbi:uncharacterized protein BX663DRAFT_504736 [Cokeromyces recurvatus]|uniref:uncharacterized protein n=1 Tax=Cokeromyces recurvatus TaxID=90255 RepID=UPI00221F5045|nr:uncharacterized protein BX663DRAFT_504736 [Cokeromyces recurvatus]KAI7904344.1 hypothetical protein BX663DRAFT_504736 [Cokeromyces recurvatus]